MWDAITALSFNLPEASLLERNLLLLNKSVNDEGTRNMAGPFILRLNFCCPYCWLALPYDAWFANAIRLLARFGFRRACRSGILSSLDWIFARSASGWGGFCQASRRRSLACCIWVKLLGFLAQHQLFAAGLALRIRGREHNHGAHECSYGVYCPVGRVAASLGHEYLVQFVGHSV